MGGYERQWIHDDFTRFGLDFIRQHRGRPFFLYLAYTIPHGRYEIPDDKPYSDRPWSDYAKRYAAMVTRLDGDVGKIFALLNELKIDERTIVFFCSDNGATFTEPPISSAGPLRGKKGTLYEGGIRTPMIVRWPGHIASGRLSDQVWAFWDFLPTAAELAGAAPPKGLDGISMVPALLGQQQRDHEFLYWEHPSGGYSQAVRHGPWKAIRASWGRPLELYHVDKDLGEKNNLAGQHPEIVARMEAFMKSEHTDSEYWPVPRN
jgi:arylsulfatase A-like enzyme